MAEACGTWLDARGVLEVTGADRHSFLQGLVTNDVTKAASDRALYAALLTAQGKYLHDFFIVSLGEALYLDVEAARSAELQRRLSLYKLRAKVTIADASERFRVAAVFGASACAKLDLPSSPGAARSFAEGCAYVDPRLAELGARLLLPRRDDAAAAPAGLAPADFAEYDRMRLALGIADGSRDLEIDKTVLLEAGFDELNGIDWQKGCYMGQELTARTKYRGLVKKRLLPVAIEGPAPAPGTRLTLATAEAGEMRSARDGHGLALLRLDRVAEAEAAGAAFAAGPARLYPHKPAWARF